MNSSRWWMGGAILLALAIGVPAKLIAQQFELPVPMASDPNQVDGGTPIRTQATHLQFCDQPHPGMPAARNFIGDGIDLEGQHYLLRDICAVPGLIRDVSPGLDALRSFALDNMGSRGAIGTLEPLDGFCPEPMSVTIAPGVAISLTIDCRLGKNRESRQSEVCDVRSEAEVGEEAALLGDLTPLIDSVVGSCQESVAPYTAARYPITVKSNEALSETAFPFPPGPPWFLSGIQWWPQLFGLDRTIYDDVITYGWANYFGRGFMTAAYDPFKVSQSVELAIDLDGPGPGAMEILLSFDPSVTFEFGHSSPLIFYRNLFDPAIGTLKLSGYLTGQFPPYGTPLDADNLYHLLVQNFNPIAVEPMLIGKRRGFAVVNQATYGFDLDQYFLIAGRPYVETVPPLPDPAGIPVAVRWGDVFRCPSAGGFTNCMSFLPHSKFAFATFWEESFPAGEPPTPWGSIPDVDRLNPNAAFGPLFQQTGAFDPDPGVDRLDAPVSLLCPGVFDAVVVEEPFTGPWGAAPTSMKRSLVVPCGERDFGEGTFLYKANPFNDRLHWRLPLAADPVPTHITVPKAYRVDSPDGFVPYGIDVAGVGGDACPDYLLTFRGQETVELNPDLDDPFVNSPGQNVVFQVSDDDQRMFADRVQVHFGEKSLGEPDCLIHVDPDITFTRTGAQFATAKFADVDGNGTLDVVVGNLVPESIAIGELGGGEFTAFTYVYADANPAAAPERIRMGFMTDPVGPVDIETAAGFIRDLAEAGDAGEGLFGVGALTTDSHGDAGSHLGAINGLPLALPPFGCPTKENVEVASPPDLIWALAQNNQAVDLDLEPALVDTDGVLIPSTCHVQHICSIEDPGTGGVLPFPFWADDICCTDPCVGEGGGVEVRVECLGFLCNPDPLIGNDALCWLISEMPIEMCAVLEGGGGGVFDPVPGGGFIPAPGGRAWSDGGLEPVPDSGGDLVVDPGDAGGGGEEPAECTFSVPDWGPGGVGTDLSLDFLPPDHPCCSATPCDTDGNPSCKDYCVGGIPPEDIVPGTPGEGGIPPLCARVISECGAGAANDDDKAEGDGKTEFARFRPDEVHHSRTPWIADIRDLRPVDMKAVSGTSSGKQKVSPRAEEAFQKFNKGFEDVLKKSQGTYEGFSLKYLNDYLFKPKKAVKKGIVPGPKKAPVPKKQKLSSWLWDLIVPPAYADCVDRPDTYIDECCSGTEDADFRSCSDFSDDDALTCCPDAPPDWRTCCLSNHCGFLIFDGGGPVCATADPDPGPGGGPGPMATGVPRLPRGQVMPGKREITVVVNKRAVEVPPDIPPGCSEGVRPIPEGLECTLHADCGEGNFCGIDCECRAIPGGEPDPHVCGVGPLEMGEQCNRDNACELGQICNIDCQCVAGPSAPGPGPDPGGGGPGTVVPGTVSLSSNDQCVWRVKGFSSDNARRLYSNASDELRAIDRLPNDHFAEREYSSVEAVCCFAGGAAPSLAPDRISLSLAGVPRAGGEGNIRPYAVIQERGPALEDFTASIWKSADPHVIDEATLILPATAAPDISPDLSSTDIFRERVVPMASLYPVNAVNLASQTTVMNNVFSHRPQAAGAGQNLSLSSDFSVRLPGTASTGQAGIDPQLAEAGAGYACHVITFRIAPDVIAPGEQWYIENRQFDFEALKAELQTRCQARELSGQPCAAEDLKALPWDAYSTYEFSVVQEKYQLPGAAASLSEQGSASVVVFVGQPASMRSGISDCHCDLAATTPPSDFALLILLALIPFMGLVVARMRI